MATTTVVTKTGLSVIVGRMQGGTPSQAEPKNVWWGLNPAALTAAATDVAPFGEASEARVAGSSSAVTTTTTNDTYQVTGTITAGGAKTIAEAGLSDSATAPTAVDAVQSGSAVIGSTSATTLVVVSGAAFATNEFIQIRTEVMKITGIATNTLTVLRAQNGSSAISTIAQNDVVTGGNPPAISTVTNGNHYVKSSFTGLALSASDSIAFTFQVAHS